MRHFSARSRRYAAKRAPCTAVIYGWIREAVMCFQGSETFECRVCDIATRAQQLS